MLSTVNVDATAIVNLKLITVASLSPSPSTKNGVSKKQWPLIVQRSAKTRQRHLVSIPGAFFWRQWLEPEITGAKGLMARKFLNYNGEIWRMVSVSNNAGVASGSVVRCCVIYLPETTRITPSKLV
jgi:hypothetical protein